MKKVKNKESMTKVRTIKQIIFTEKPLKIFFYKIVEITRSIDLSKLHDAILTNIKDTNLQADNCFLCYKSDHIFRKCSDQSSRINALNNENKFDHSSSESDSDSKN